MTATLENALRCAYEARTALLAEIGFDYGRNEFIGEPTPGQAEAVRSIHATTEHLINAIQELEPAREFGWWDRLIPVSA